MADIIYNNVPVLSQIKAKGKIYYLKDAEVRVQLQEEANAREAAITQVLKDAKDYTDEKIAKIEHIKYELVDALPEASADVEFNTSLTVYLVKDHSATKDVYCEYICVATTEEGVTSYNWEKLGDSDIDFSKYYTKDEIDTKEQSLKDLIAAEQTRAEGIESGLDTRIKALEDADVPLATETEVGGIKIGHVEAEGEAAVKLDADGKAYVEATQYTAAEGGGLKLEGTAFSIKEVSADLIVNGTNSLIINGGNAAE